jgi:hypothetical protein
MPDVIFYSWQSDLPNAINRTFIEEALRKAARALRNDSTITVEPVIERDTAGVAGAPAIQNTIFHRIERAQVVVCDISIINHGAPQRPTPNPNVLVEFGYALKALGDQHLILVMNRAFGTPEALPFDLRYRRILSYTVASADDPTRLDQRRELERDLGQALRDIFAQIPAEGEEPRIGSLVTPTAHSRGGRAPLWERTIRNIFFPPATVPSRPPFLMCAVTPALSADPADFTGKEHELFSRLCMQVFGVSARRAILNEQDGIIFDPSQMPDNQDDFPLYGCAYRDGSIGFRWTFPPTGHSLEKGPWRQDLIQTWRLFRTMLVPAALWPRQLLGYQGPLVCRLGMGNIASTILSVPRDFLVEWEQVPPILNKKLQWVSETEWEIDTPVNDLLQDQMAHLARQLQFRHFHELLHVIRPEAQVD